MSSSSTSSLSRGSSKLETPVCIKEPSGTNNGMQTASMAEALPPEKRVLATCATAAAAYRNSADNNGDTTTTPTSSAKRLKRVSMASQDATSNDENDATTSISSLSSKSCGRTDRSAGPPESCGCACPCHQPVVATGCVPTTNNMVQNNARPDASSNGAPLPVVASQKPSSSKQDVADDKNAAAATLVLEHVGYDSSATGGSHVVPKRQDYISWDDYFMSVAALSSFRSKDPQQPAGCCLVDHRHRIVGIGYNGFPARCSDDCLPWSSSGSGNIDEVIEQNRIWLHTKHPYMCHAEVNAILNKCSADIAERGARLYVLDFPCNECAKVIIQAGLSEVIYLRDDDEPDDSRSLSRASRLMFIQAGVKLRRHEPERTCIDLEFGQFLDTAEEDREKINRIIASTTSIPTTTTFTTTLQEQQHRGLMLLEARGYDPWKMTSGKRTDYISWDDYFMAVAFLTAQRSKDPSTQVGACIVMNQRIVGLGYNGFPAGCSDDHLPWARTDPINNNLLHTKYPYVCHAEMNAILNKCTTDIHGATIYVALFPCNECTKVIIQSGIREVVYMSDKYHDTEMCRASRIMLQMAGVKMRKYIPSKLNLAIHLGPKPAK